MHADVRTVSGLPPYASALRVLHVAQPSSAGVPRLVGQLAAHQAAGGWDVHVAADLAVSGPGVRHHAWHATRSPLSQVGPEGRALRVIVDYVDPDVVVLHSAKAGLIGRLVLRGERPTVFVPHAWSFLALPGVAGQAARAWERYAARWTNVVVAVSDGEADAGRRAGIRAPTFVVETGVPDGWRPVPYSARARRRAGLGLPHGPTVVCVGRLCRQKGQDILLRAWESVVERVPAATLVLVGDGELPGRTAKAGLPPGVRLVGLSAVPHDYVAAADVVVVPSRWEGASLAMLEAMMTGRSVVTTDVSGAGAVRAANAGAVVDVGSPASLADALIVRLVGDLDVESEGAAGAAYVATHRRADVALERFAAVLSRAPVFGGPAAAAELRPLAAHVGVEAEAGVGVGSERSA